MVSGRKKNYIGKITAPPGVFLEAHEKRTIDFLAQTLHLDISCIPPGRTPNTSSADIIMDEQEWEIKSPKGKSSRTIENNLRAALRQSQYIILDLRRMDRRTPSKKHTSEAQKQFQLTHSIQRMLIITREESLIDLKR